MRSTLLRKVMSLLIYIQTSCLGPVLGQLVVLRMTYLCMCLLPVGIHMTVSGKQLLTACDGYTCLLYQH